MKKLYEKNELLFAILWIVLYTVVMGNLRPLGDDSPYPTIGLAVICLGAFLFVKANGLMEKYGLACWQGGRKMLWLIPLWLITSGNLWGGIKPDYPMPGLLYGILTMAMVGFAEELIFRGFLFKAMINDGSSIAAIIVCAVSFGLGHILNLFIGQDFFDTITQVIGAIAIGFIYTMVFYKSGSLLPCILSHSLIDVTSKLTPGKSLVLDWVYFGLLFVVALAYCLYLRKVPTPQINLPEKKES
ncbi:MAG: CPBP family intramembrane metalloprotease [Erysipelotrichaceae bacterium]|nr:CPBP family intramembrane metalloprotease [Erysipelotrichaceae bacterium]